MLHSFGLDGPKVLTALPTTAACPGEPIMGAVRLRGGEHDLDVDTVAVGLVTRVEAEDGDAMLEFHRAWVAAGFTLAAREQQDIPFTITPPWETPVSYAYGHRLTGMCLDLRTEVVAADGSDWNDAEVLEIHPLPAQERVLAALAGEGFHLRHADVERGAIYGVRLELPFYQEIEFTPPPHRARVMDELELTFVADAAGTEVILEFERHGGFLRKARDAYARFRLEHDSGDPGDAVTALHEALPRSL